MIIHKKCEIEELPEGVIGQVGLDQLVHYTEEYHRSETAIIASFMEYLKKKGAYPDYYT